MVLFPADFVIPIVFGLVVVKRTQVLEPEEMSPGAVQASPRPPMPKANQLEPKRARIERWKNNPAEMEKDMAKQRESLARAEKEDALVCMCVFLFVPDLVMRRRPPVAVRLPPSSRKQLWKGGERRMDRRDGKYSGVFITLVLLAGTVE